MVPFAEAGESSDNIVVGRGEKGDGMGENPLSENVADDGVLAQPKKVPSLEDAGDFGKGLEVSPLLSNAGNGAVACAPVCGASVKCGGVGLRAKTDMA